MESGWRPPVTDEVLAQLRTTDPLAVERWQAAKDYASARTRFFDDLLRKACDDQIDQIVILAAGLDSRVWRFTWPKQVTVYEIDQPKSWPSRPKRCRDMGSTPPLRAMYQSGSTFVVIGAPR
jgi:methyltransferase (TIGR00027 family)